MELTALISFNNDDKESWVRESAADALGNLGKTSTDVVAAVLLMRCGMRW